MLDSAAVLVDEIFPTQPVRQWVLSFPYPMRLAQVFFVCRRPGHGR
jgi:hypothetical protein